MSRGIEPSEFTSDAFWSDQGLFRGYVPMMQYLDMLTFYEECLQAYLKMKEYFVITKYSLREIWFRERLTK